MPEKGPQITHICTAVLLLGVESRVSFSKPGRPCCGSGFHFTVSAREGPTHWSHRDGTPPLCLLKQYLQILKAGGSVGPKLPHVPTACFDWELCCKIWCQAE